MPKSKHRKLPFRTRVQMRARDEKLDREASGRRRIYDLALPEKQEYPPSLIPRGDLMTTERRERIARIKAQAEERRQRRNQKRVGQVVEPKRRTA